MKGLVRDVLVNVVANLIAGAVLYLLLAWAGLFPTIGRLVWASASIVLASAAYALGVTVRTMRRQDPERAARLTITLIGVVALTTTTISAGYFAFDSTQFRLTLAWDVLLLSIAVWGSRACRTPDDTTSTCSNCLGAGSCMCR